MTEREQLFHIRDKLIKECSEIMDAKNHDYAGDGSPFSNFQDSTILGISVTKGILLRVIDKIKRIQSFDEKGELKVKGEGVRDAVMDVINYMILLYAEIELREATPNISFNMTGEKAVFDEGTNSCNVTERSLG